MSLAVTISTVCPSNEVDELTMSLLNIFESRGLTYQLLEALIKQEIEETGMISLENPPVLLLIAVCRK
jgi:neurofibromin 1